MVGKRVKSAVRSARSSDARTAAEVGCIVIRARLQLMQPRLFTLSRCAFSLVTLDNANIRYPGMDRIVFSEDAIVYPRPLNPARPRRRFHLLIAPIRNEGFHRYPRQRHPPSLCRLLWVSSMSRTLATTYTVRILSRHPYQPSDLCHVRGPPPIPNYEPPGQDLRTRFLSGAHPDHRRIRY